jgi:hypothetical protein
MQQLQQTAKGVDASGGTCSRSPSWHPRLRCFICGVFTICRDNSAIVARLQRGCSAGAARLQRCDCSRGGPLIFGISIVARLQLGCNAGAARLQRCDCSRGRPHICYDFYHYLLLHVVLFGENSGR